MSAQADVYLYRRKHGLPITDPRVLNATPEQIRLDLELDIAARGEEPEQCPRCDGWTYATTCACSPGVPIDPVEALLAEKGDDITHEDFERLYNGEGESARKGR